MPGLSKVIVLEPDARAGRQLQLGFEREGVPTAVAGPQLDLPAEDAGVVVVGGSDTHGVELVQRARSWLAKTGVDAPIVFAGRGAAWRDVSAAGADEIIHPPAYLRDVITIARLIRGLPAARREHLTGSLLEVTGVFSLIRALAALGRSATLTLVRGLRRGEMRFFHGEVTSAQVGMIHGQAALHQLLLWTDARFDFHHEDVVRRHQIPLAPDELFADAAGFLASVRESSGGLSPAMVLEQNMLRVQTLGRQIPTEVHGVLRMFDGHRALADVLEDSAYRVFETLRVAQRAMEAGLLRVVANQPPRPAWRPVLEIEEWLVGGLPFTPAPRAVTTPSGSIAAVAAPSGSPTREQRTTQRRDPTASRKRRKKHRRTQTPPAVAVAPVSAAAEPPNDIDWGALVPRIVGAEVGPLAGVVPASGVSGEIVTVRSGPAGPARAGDRAAADRSEPSVVLDLIHSVVSHPGDTDPSRAVTARLGISSPSGVDPSRTVTDRLAAAWSPPAHLDPRRAVTDRLGAVNPPADLDPSRSPTRDPTHTVTDRLRAVGPPIDFDPLRDPSRRVTDRLGAWSPPAHLDPGHDPSGDFSRAVTDRFAAANPPGKVDDAEVDDAELEAQLAGAEPELADVEPESADANAAASGATAAPAAANAEPAVASSATAVADTSATANAATTEAAAASSATATPAIATAEAPAAANAEPAVASSEAAVADTSATANAATTETAIAGSSTAAPAISPVAATPAATEPATTSSATAASSAEPAVATAELASAASLSPMAAADGGRTADDSAPRQPTDAAPEPTDPLDVADTRPARRSATDAAAVQQTRSGEASDAITAPRAFPPTDATPDELVDEPSDGVIRDAIPTPERKSASRRLPSVPPENDRPGDTTGEIVMPRSAAPTVDLTTSEPTILVADLAAVHAAVSATLDRHAPAPTSDAASPAHTAQINELRSDATAFSDTEEAFFRAGHDRDPGHAPPSHKESFSDLDEGYRPLGFWARLRRRRRPSTGH